MFQPVSRLLRAKTFQKMALGNISGICGASYDYVGSIVK